MKDESMITVAEKILRAQGSSLKFPELWEKVKKELEIDPIEADRRIGHFYTDLSMAGGFVNLGENVWDLRERHKFDKVHLDTNAFYSDAEERDTDAVEEAEEAEYDASVRGSLSEDDEGDAGSDEEGGDSKPRENASDLLGISGDNY